MTELATKGGGAMEAIAGTLSGKWTTLQNSISDFREEVGRTITESLGLKDGLQWLSEKFDALSESAKSGKLHTILADAGTAVQNWAKQITDIVKQINSVEDLKIVAGVIGDWLKDKLIEGGHHIAAFLVEKAPVIGDAVGRAIVDGMNSVAQDAADRYVAKQQMEQRGIERTPENVNQYVHETRAASFAAQGKELAAQIEISAASQQSLADRINTALQASRQAESNEGTGLIRVQIPEGEFIGDAAGLQEFIDDLRETDAALADMLQQAVDTQAGADKVHEETTKSLSGVQQSHTSVQSALRSSGAAATATSQVATQTVQVAQQVVASQAMLAGQLSSLRSDISRINAQLRSMRA
jgi:hypothetical protein